MVRKINESKKWGKFNGLHYMIADQDYESWNQEDYLNVMYACRDLKKMMDFADKYGMDTDNPRIKDLDAEISSLIDIANKNANKGMTESQNSSSAYYELQSFIDDLTDYIDENDYLITIDPKVKKGKDFDSYNLIIRGAYSDREIGEINIDHSNKNIHNAWTASFNFGDYFDDASSTYIEGLEDFCKECLDELYRNIDRF